MLRPPYRRSRAALQMIESSDSARTILIALAANSSTGPRPLALARAVEFEFIPIARVPESLRERVEALRAVVRKNNPPQQRTNSSGV